MPLQAAANAADAYLSRIADGRWGTLPELHRQTCPGHATVHRMGLLDETVHPVAEIDTVNNITGPALCLARKQTNQQFCKSATDATLVSLRCGIRPSAGRMDSPGLRHETLSGILRPPRLDRRQFERPGGAGQGDRRKLRCHIAAHFRTQCGGQSGGDPQDDLRNSFEQRIARRLGK